MITYSFKNVLNFFKITLLNSDSKHTKTIAVATFVTNITIDSMISNLEFFIDLIHERI